MPRTAAHTFLRCFFKHGQLVLVIPLHASTAAADREVACAAHDHEQCQSNLQNRRLAYFAAEVTLHIVQCDVM